MKILKIFITFFRVGALTLGGGLAMISVLRHEIIVKRGWINDEEFSRELALATALPGAMVVNFSLFCGYKMRGIAGAGAAFLGAVLPSFLIIIIVVTSIYPYFNHPAAAAFLRGALASVAGLLSHTAFTMCKPMITRAPHFIAALIAAAIALIPSVNPIFALITVTVFVLFFTANRKSKQVREGGES